MDGDEGKAAAAASAAASAAPPPSPPRVTASSGRADVDVENRESRHGSARTTSTAPASVRIDTGR